MLKYCPNLCLFGGRILTIFSLYRQGVDISSHVGLCLFEPLDTFNVEYGELQPLQKVQHKCHHRVTLWPVQGSAGQRLMKCMKREFCDAVAGDSRVSTTVTQNTPFTHGCSYFWCQDVNEPFCKSQLKPSNTLVSVRADSKSNLCFWAMLPLWEALLTVMNVTHQNALTQFW